MLLDHAIATPTLGITATSRNMTGRLLIKNNDTLCALRNGFQDFRGDTHSSSAPCFVDPVQSLGLDFFLLSDLLEVGARVLGCLDVCVALACEREKGFACGGTDLIDTSPRCCLFIARVSLIHIVHMRAAETMDVNRRGTSTSRRRLRQGTRSGTTARSSCCRL